MPFAAARDGTTLHDRDIRFGPPVGAGGECPPVRETILAADLLILGEPIWMGSGDSIARDSDDQGRTPSYGKVAATVGDKDGAPVASAQILQASSDVAWIIPDVAASCPGGEEPRRISFRDPNAISNRSRRPRRPWPSTRSMSRACSGKKAMRADV